MVHLNSYTRLHLLSVVEKLQWFFALYSSPFVSADAVIGIHKAVLHALSVFDVDADTRDYIDEMVNKGYGAGTLEDHIERRIAHIQAERNPRGYPADWPLRGLLVILRDMPLTPYGPDRSLPRRVYDYYMGVPTRWQLDRHEEALLKPVGVNLTEIVLAYYGAQRSEAA